MAKRPPQSSFLPAAPPQRPQKRSEPPIWVKKQSRTWDQANLDRARSADAQADGWRNTAHQPDQRPRDSKGRLISNGPGPEEQRKREIVGAMAIARRDDIDRDGKATDHLAWAREAYRKGQREYKPGINTHHIAKPKSNDYNDLLGKLKETLRRGGIKGLREGQ